jgi:ABC-type dipeptide/oligopeptide/nickel transport system permease subunit
MLADGQPYMQTDPWLVLFPGLAIFITALSLTMAGRGIGRDTGATEPAGLALGGVQSR